MPMSMPSKSEKLTFQPPHPLNESEAQFLASASEMEKQLYELASQMLGSSHFTGKTHGYKASMKKKEQK